MTWIKICGITCLPDAQEGASLGVNALGFIFAPSPRRIDPHAARSIIRHLPEKILKVGVFVNEALPRVLWIADYCRLDMVQFHGTETLDYCREVSLPVIKGIPVKDEKSLEEMERYPSVAILLDTFARDRAGGTGKAFSWGLALEARKKRNFILSGGLCPENVGQAIHLLQPLGVDVSSGVEERPGKKDVTRMNDFVKEVKKANDETR